MVSPVFVSPTEGGVSPPMVSGSGAAQPSGAADLLLPPTAVNTTTNGCRALVGGFMGALYCPARAASPPPDPNDHGGSVRP